MEDRTSYENVAKEWPIRIALPWQHHLVIVLPSSRIDPLVSLKIASTFKNLIFG